jgi:hypothetical protein
MHMKVHKIREIARKMGIDAGGKTKTDLVRAIQKAEGYQPCFASPQVYKCSQDQCMWRRDCAQEVHEEDLNEPDPA